MSQLNANGWKILFYTDFRTQWEELKNRAIKLKSRLDPEDFVRHPDVKLLKAVDTGIRARISLVTLLYVNRSTNTVASKKWGYRNAIGYSLEPLPSKK
jgi:hypothetical protein